MKHVSFALFILVASCGLVAAGPEPVRDISKSVVPVPTEACSWTGFYMGGSAGGAFAADADFSLDLGGHWNDVVPPPDRQTVSSLGQHDLGGNAFVGGAFLGYNFQWDHWVLGIEAAADFVGLRDSFNSGIVTVPATGDEANFRESYQTDYRAMVSPRVGFAWDRFLVYATGGLAIGNLEFSQEIKGKGAGFHEEGSADDTQVGWTAGGGVAVCLTKHWSARAEYRYTDLGCADFSSAGNKTGGVVDFSGFTGNHQACLAYHSVTAGLAFKF